MLKKFWCGVAALSVVFIVAGIIAVTMSAHQVTVQAQTKTPPPAQAIHGLPIDKPVRTPIQPPVLTRDQLVTRGHAEDIVEITQLFYTYIFYHDTHNGPGVASLFTKDGILETLWNNSGKTIEPNAGPTGRGCLEYGQQQIAEFFERSGNNPLPFPGYSHNQATNVLVQVHGDTATLYANWTTIHVGSNSVPPNTAIVSHNGEYVSDLRRTPEGWRFIHHRAIEDGKVKFGTPVCEQNVVEGQ